MINDTIPSNNLKNKELTKQKLIKAVGELLQESGHTKLGINKIARRANVDKKLIYRYFGGIERLLQTYLREQDFWISYVKQLETLSGSHQAEKATKLAIGILQHQLDYLYKNSQMQKILLWEITESNPIFEDIAHERELIENTLLNFSDKRFEDPDTDFRTIFALLIAGIYYLVLHAKTSETTFFDIDVKTQGGREQVYKAIQQIVTWAFAEENIKSSK